MDIRCPECQTLYEFDESRLESGSATLKCRKCQHMFRLGEDSRPSREDEQRWMVRDADKGDVLYFNAFDTLHRWIVERKVDRSWQISRSGDHWTQLGEIGEFRPIFQVVDNVSSIEGQGAVRKSSGEVQRERESGSQGRSKKNTLEQFHQSGTASTDRASESQPTSAARPGASDSSEAAAARSGEISGAQSSSRSDRPSPRDQTAKRPERSSSPHSVPTQSSGEEPAAQSGSTSGVTEPAAQSAELQTRSGESTTTGEESSAGGPTNVSGPGRGDPEGSNVQLDTGMFGSQDESGASGDEDEWAFGEQEVGFEETTNVAEDDLQVESGGGRRWSVVVTVAVVLLAGGGSYLWFFQRDRVRSVLGMAEERDAVRLQEEKQKPSEQEPRSDSTGPSRERLHEALAAARERAGAKSAKLFETAHASASETLVSAVGAAGEKAEEEGDEQEESVSSMLRSANRKLQSGAPQSARQAFHDIIEREPANSEAITGLGWSLVALGNVEAARAQFKKALHHNPTYGDAYIGLGQTNRRLGAYEKALEAYTTYLEKLPDGSQASIARHQKKALESRLGVN